MHAFLHVVPNFHSSARCSFSVLQERLANLEACATEDETGGGDSEPSGTLGTQRPPRAAGITLKGDVETFAWILHYIEAPLRPPTLNAALVVNVLVAADALAMDHLVHHSLRYMCAHLRDVLRTSLDLTCIHDKLAVSLADLVHPAAAKLAGLKDRRDMLLPRIYKRRLELDFRATKKGDRLSCCKWCGKLFHTGAISLLKCSFAPSSTTAATALNGFHHSDAVPSRHAPQPDWSLTECVSRLHRHGMGWEDIYWLLWGVSHVFYCRATNGHFMASDYSRRRYHPRPPSPPQISDGAYDGRNGLNATTVGAVYACCESGPNTEGCCFGKHVVDDSQGAVAFLTGGARKLDSGRGTSVSGGAGFAKNSTTTLTARRANEPPASPSNNSMAYQAVRSVLEQQQEQLARSSQHAAVVLEAASAVRKAKDSGANSSSLDAGSSLGEEEQVLLTIPCAPTPNRLPPPWPPSAFEAQNAERALRRAFTAATHVHNDVAGKSVARALRRWLLVSLRCDLHSLPRT